MLSVEHIYIRSTYACKWHKDPQCETQRWNLFRKFKLVKKNGAIGENLQTVKKTASRAPGKKTFRSFKKH